MTKKAEGKRGRRGYALGDLYRICKPLGLRVISVDLNAGKINVYKDGKAYIRNIRDLEIEADKVIEANKSIPKKEPTNYSEVSKEIARLVKECRSTNKPSIEDGRVG